ncbi:MAG: ABC transporter permease, partial [Clostridia bacterium]|nr:ABC transporter permease [Clostridia bacterium]
MRDMIIIMMHTMKERLTKKSFIISNLIIFAVIIAMFNIPNIMEKTQAGETNKVLLVDSTNIFEDSLTSLNNMGLENEFIVEKEMLTEEEINTRIENNEIIGAVMFYKDAENIKFNYIVAEIGKGPDPAVLQNLFSKLNFNIEVSKLNLSQEQLNSMNAQIVYDVKTITGEEMPTFSFSIVLLSIALFFAIYFCAYQVSAEVTMEKTSKIMETLVTSTSPKAILLGKTIGTGLVGIIQLLATTIVSVVSYKVFTEGKNTIDFLDFSQVTPMAIVIAFIYFILGYTLYAFLYALVGSTVSKPEDIQSANAPVAMISLFGFYFGYFTVLFSPTGTMTKVASLVPFSSPFSMPFRMMMVNVPTWEIIASIVILIVTILITIQVSIRIYSAAVLHYGSKIN